MGSEDTPDSCGGKTCEHGARCDSETQTCSCQLIDCPPETLVEAVCGSDGQTYASECQLIRQACEKGVHILIVAYNPCSQGEFAY